MQTANLGQNFLRNKRTARRLVHLAGGTGSELCMDLGAGNGAITAAADAIRSGPIWAVELDRRLLSKLKNSCKNMQNVEVISGDLLKVSLPTEPFVIASNPPFNASTKLVKRWTLHKFFVSGALIVEQPFAHRISGNYGSNKLSLSMSPFLTFDIPFQVRSAEFSPKPKVSTVILTIVRNESPDVAWAKREQYWRFVNYLFERGQATVGQALDPLRLSGVSPQILACKVSEVTKKDIYSLFEVGSNSKDARRSIDSFTNKLPSARRPMTDKDQ